MLPGISAEDCLFADLGVDPAEAGCQSYEATRFLERRPAIEPRAALILWQIGVVGSANHSAEPVAPGSPTSSSGSGGSIRTSTRSSSTRRRPSSASRR